MPRPYDSDSHDSTAMATSGMARATHVYCLFIPTRAWVTWAKPLSLSCARHFTTHTVVSQIVPALGPTLHNPPVRDREGKTKPPVKEIISGGNGAVG